MTLQDIGRKIQSIAESDYDSGSYQARGIPKGLQCIGLGLFAIAVALEKKEEKDGRPCCDKSGSA